VGAIGVALALFWGYAALVGGLVFAEVGRRARWTGFLTPLLAPPITLYATIGTHIPKDAVPIVLTLLFVGIWLVFQRLMRQPPAPQPATANAESKPA